MMLDRWVSTVFVLISSRAAISLLVLPSARSWTISRLAGGEATARGLFGRARRCAFQVTFEHHLLDLGGKERFAPAESVDGGDQVPPCVRFQHEPASAGFERLAD